MIFQKEDGVICLTDYDNTLVFPLLVEEIEMLRDDKNYFENYINLKYMADEFLPGTPIEEQYKLYKETKSNLPWLAIWVIVSAKDKTIVGTLDFKALPDENGEIEIGYYVSPSFRCRGFATTAVKLICDWAFENGAKKVVAETYKQNIASKKVLTNNDFDLKDCNNNLLIFEKSAQE